MAWIPGTQNEGAFGGAKVEWGYVTLTTAAEAVEVTTHMKVVDSAHATYRQLPDAATKLVCDCTITNGAVTIQDDVGAETNDRVINYLFLGR